MSTPSLTQFLIETNRETAKYYAPLDGVVSFGVMYLLVALDVKPVIVVTAGAILHGVLHPVIATPK